MARRPRQRDERPRRVACVSRFAVPVGVPHVGGAFPNGVAGRTTPTPQTTPGRQMPVDHVAVWTRP
ncbi:hypothetical protein [Lentzea guizhouensis]|uniref:hypothetical protein n=1 Tax=Lentzea guizhouensis TaxID=1586287 RepID=UPI001C54C444|nr:hypothetical protein [Lentzea guizhouensis]